MMFNEIEIAVRSAIVNITSRETGQLNYSTDLYFCNEDVYPLGITHKWNGLIANFTLDNTLTFSHLWLLNIKGSFALYYESSPTQTKATGLINLFSV